MSITISEIVEDRAQIDGRRSIREKHTDHEGVDHFIEYLAEADADVDAAKVARVAVLEQQLRDNEIRRNLDRAYDQEQPTFIHSTPAQFRTVLRAAYIDAKGWDATRLGQFIWSQNLTDNQLINLFGISAAQLPQLKARLDRQHQRYLDVTGEEGA